VDALEKAAALREKAGGVRDRDGARLLRQDLDAALLECCKVGTPVAMAEYLLSAGADLNTTNAQGETPIMVASRYDRKDLVQFLLHRSCDFVSGRTARRRRSSIGGGAY
jgi:ankyrin repeat protein